MNYRIKRTIPMPPPPPQSRYFKESFGFAFIDIINDIKRLIKPKNKI